MKALPLRMEAEVVARLAEARERFGLRTPNGPLPLVVGATFQLMKRGCLCVVNYAKSANNGSASHG